MFSTNFFVRYLYYLLIIQASACGLDNSLLKLDNNEDVTLAINEENTISLSIVFEGKQVANFTAEISDCSTSQTIFLDQSLVPLELEAINTGCVFKIMTITIAETLYDYSSQYSTADWTESSKHSILSPDGLTSLILTVEKAIPNTLSKNFSIIVNLETQTIDLTSPSLLSSVPANESQNVSINQEISLSFSEKIKAGSGSLTLFSGNSSPYSEFLKIASSNDEKVIIKDKDITLKLGQIFTSFTKYHLQIDSEAITDLNDNKFSGLNLGSFSFTTADINAPNLNFVSQITSPSNDNTPSFVISSNEAGSISYSGSCSSSDTSYSSEETQKTITLTALADGTYNDCSLTLTDNVGNFSSLTLNSFVIDTEELLSSALSGSSDTGIVNAWQRINSGSKKLTAVSFYMDNTHSTNNYDLYINVYTTDEDPSNANPNSKFSGTPIVQSNTVTLPKNTNSMTEFKFTIPGDSLSLNTNYYLFIKTDAPSNPSWTGGQSIRKYSDGSTTGGAGNNFGQLNHKVYGRNP